MDYAKSRPQVCNEKDCVKRMFPPPVKKILHVIEKRNGINFAVNLLELKED